MKREEPERLYSISAQLKHGFEHISTGRIEIGRVWTQEAARSLSILITVAEEKENDRE